MISEQMQYLQKKSKINTELSALETKLESLKLEYDEFLETKLSTVDSTKYAYIAENTDRIKDKYRDEILNIRNEIKDLEDKSTCKDTTGISNEETLILRERQEYLNQAAIQTDNMLHALEKVSNTYFIDLANDSKELSYKKYLKELKNVPNYIKNINDYKSKKFIPVIITSKLQSILDCKINSALSLNIATYISALLSAPITILSIPFIITNGILRAKKLHYYSRKYHMLARSTISLNEKTSDELRESLEKILILRRESIINDLDLVQEKLDDILCKQQDEIYNLVFDETDLCDLLDKQEEQIVNDIKDTNTRIEELTKERDAITKIIDELIRKHKEALALEREPYINPENSDRSVQFPKRYLYDYTEDKNTWINLVPGLYIYDDRTSAEELMRLISFQMRNFMGYQAINIYALDPLMGLSVSDMIMSSANNNNLYIDSMKNNQESRIITIHDMMERRKTTVKSVAIDLNQFNELQQASGSSPLSFEVLFYFFESSITLSERVIQLLKIGETLGLYLIIFIDRESLKLESVVMYEKYVGNIVEISPNGITQTTPSIFRSYYESTIKKR